MLARLSHGGSQAEEKETPTDDEVEKNAEESEDPIFDMEIGMIAEELKKRKESGEDISNSVTVINTPKGSVEVEEKEEEEQCTGDPFLDSLLGRLRSCEEEVEKEESKTPYEKDQERFMRDDYSTGDPKIDRIFNRLKVEKKVKESELKPHDRLTDSNMTVDHMFKLLCEGNADAEECINELLKAGETDQRAGLCIYSRVDSRGCYGKDLADVWIASDRDVQKFIDNINDWHK
jgi:hypothetical protein